MRQSPTPINLPYSDLMPSYIHPPSFPAIRDSLFIKNRDKGFMVLLLQASQSCKHGHALAARMVAIVHSAPLQPASPLGSRVFDHRSAVRRRKSSYCRSRAMVPLAVVLAGAVGVWEFCDICDRELQNFSRPVTPIPSPALPHCVGTPSRARGFLKDVVFGF